MQKFIYKPSIDMLAGIKVTKETTLEYENENVKQTLKDLVFDSTTTVNGYANGENYISTYHTVITLNEGDILIFEEEGRGYIKPVENFVTVEEAIKELECLKEG